MSDTFLGWTNDYDRAQPKNYGGGVPMFTTSTTTFDHCYDLLKSFILARPEILIQGNDTQHKLIDDLLELVDYTLYQLSKEEGSQCPE